MPDDIDAVALAEELGVKEGEPPKQAPSSETPPKGDETPKPDTTEGDQPPKEEATDGDEPVKGETPPDPLDELAKDPKFLQRILAHKELGPKVNRWADDAAKHQVDAARRESPGPTEEQIKEKLQIEKEDKFFGEISEEDLAKELADPQTGKDAAAAYGRYQLRQQAKAREPSTEDIAFQVQVEAAKSLVVTYRSMVEDSDLPDEVKEGLQPEKFTQYGPAALVRWGRAIYEAHVKYGIDQLWESEKEQRLAELDKDRPSTGGGRPPGKVLDLMSTPSEVGLTQALAEEERKRK